MKNCVLVIVLILSVGAFAQNNLIGLSFSPNYAYRIFQIDDLSNTSSLRDEYPKLGYRIMVNFERNFHKRASFFTGISFVNNGYQTGETDYRFSGSQQNPPPYRAFNIRTNIYQLSIPLGVNLFFQKNKFRFFLNAGIAAQYLMSMREARLNYTLDNKTEKSFSSVDESFYKPFSFAAFGSFGIEFNLNENYVMRIAPNIYYTLTNIMEDKILYRIYPTSSGVNIGIWHTL